MKEVVLSLQGVSKWFTGLHALTDVSIDCMRGERIAIIGPNGAGKTTLFNVISGERKATKGKVILFGKDITNFSVKKRVELGLRRTYQSTSIFEKLDVKQNLALSLLGLTRGLKLFSNSDNFISNSKRIYDIGKSVGLSDRINSLSGDLSHGERRQLEVGLSITHMPQIVLLDEPAAGLSPKERELLINLLHSLQDDITLLIVEHDMEVALRVAKRVIVLHEGKVLVSGTPEEVTANKIVQDIYLGGKIDE